jgi:iron complex transport system substrate-binding protein
MKKIASLLILFALALALFAGCGTKNAENTPDGGTPSVSGAPTGEPQNQNTASGSERSDFKVTDLLGREVLIPGNASSFVCIGPGCLRLYCYVADTAKLAGIEEIEKDVTGRPYMMAHKELTSLTVIGQGGPNNAPDAEKILLAEPDVIFSTYNSDASAVDELQSAAGIPVVVLSYGKTALFDPNVDKSLELIGLITQNEERASEVTEYFASMKADLAERCSGIADEDKTTIYLGAQSMKGTHGIESTSGNYEIFNALNAKNVVDAAGIHEYAMLDKEALIDMNPDVIILDAGGYPLVKDDYDANTAYYDSLSAFKNGRVYLQMPYNYYSTNIEVALADAYYVGSVLYPDKFADVDIASKFDEISEKLLGASLYSEFAETYFGGYQQVSFGS